MQKKVAVETPPVNNKDNAALVAGYPSVLLDPVLAQEAMDRSMRAILPQEIKSYLSEPGTFIG